MYRFCNAGHCFDFSPKKKIRVNPNKAPIPNLEYYRDRVKQAKSKSVFIVDDFGQIEGTELNLWVKVAKPTRKG